MSKRPTAQTALLKSKICGSCDPDGYYQDYLFTCCASFYVVDQSWRSNPTTHIISLSAAAYSDINFYLTSDVRAIGLRCSSVQNCAGTSKWNDDCLTFSVGRPTFVYGET